MDEKKTRTFFKQAADILRDFLPGSAAVLGPLLYSVAVWAVEKKNSCRERIEELRVWLLPEILVNKPDDFVLNFFQTDERLMQAYADELSAANLKKLRQDFAILYPILGLQDPFLEALFWPEIESADFRKITAEYRPRVERALKEIKTAEGQPEFWTALEEISRGLLELGWQVLSEAEVRKWLRHWLKSHINS